MSIRDVLSFRITDSQLRYVKPILVWLSGFILGSLTARSAGPHVFSLMLRAIQTPMSIDGLLTAYFLPFLISVAVSHFQRESWLLAVCFAKAFSYAYLAHCLVTSLSCAWLLLPLLFFSDLYISVLLLWMCVRGNSLQAKNAYTIPLLLTAVAASLDFFLVSPFLAAIVV